MPYNFDVVIIGGGFYGSILALFLKTKKNKVALIEKEDDLILRASYANQARIHNGYHYPRSFLTAYRSHANYLRFIKDFKSAVYSDFKSYYAIAANLSKTTSSQFVKFCAQVGSSIRPAPEKIKKLFNRNLIDEIYEVDEVVFDADALREVVKKKLRSSGVKMFLGTSVRRVRRDDKKNAVVCFTGGHKKIFAKEVYNCAYSGINDILINSRLATLPFKEEFIEMPLISVPPELKGLSVTVIDGPFFGFLPFPDKNCHSLWHVRYAVRASWTEPSPRGLTGKLKKIEKKSKWNFMKRDIQRFIPALSEAEYLESIFETKTVLLEKEENDARPILFRKNYGIKGFHVVMGGKLDNIYDIIERIEEAD